MKSALLLFITLSTAAFACPQLEGTYTCRSLDGSVATAKFKQNGHEYVVEWPGVEPLRVPADGKTYSKTDKQNGSTNSTTATSSCQDRSVVSRALDVTQQGSYTMTAEANLDILQFNADELHLVADVRITENGVQQPPVTLDTTCKKQ